MCGVDVCGMCVRDVCAGCVCVCVCVFMCCVCVFVCVLPVCVNVHACARLKRALFFYIDASACVPCEDAYRWFAPSLARYVCISINVFFCVYNITNPHNSREARVSVSVSVCVSVSLSVSVCVSVSVSVSVSVKRVTSLT